MGVLNRINAMAAIAGVAAALAAPPSAQAWEWPWAGMFTDEMVVDANAGDDQPVTFGTGWYLRGDLNVGKDIQLNTGGALLPSSNNFPNSLSYGLGAGYKFNNWIRSDVTVDYSSNRTFTGSTSGPVQCQVDAYKHQVGVDAAGNPVYGIVPVYDMIGCANSIKTRMSSFTMLWNVYADLGTWYGLTPYVGVGLGGTLFYEKMSQNWFRMSNGTPYAPTWTDPLSQSSVSVNWDQARSLSTFQPAWAAMFGASYAVTPHASIDVGYRFLNQGKFTNYGSFAGVTTQYLKTHQVRVGFRYTPD